MPLIVVETLGKQRQLEGLLRKLTLSGQWDVVSCGGHYCGLPKNQIGLDFKTLEPIWKVRSTQSFDRMKRAVSLCDMVYAASDLSPEGEAIANQIRITAEFGSKPFHRLRLASLDATSLQEALESPSSIDLSSFHSYLARDVVDRFVQFLISPVITHRLGEEVSVNRLSLLLLSEVARVERKVRRFTPSSYYIVRALLSDGSTAESQPLSSWKEAEEIVRRAKAAVPAFSCGRDIDSVLPPFTLSSLIQFASSRYGISAISCIQTCETLYGQGLITYPYTSTPSLSLKVANEIHSFVREKLASDKVAEHPVTFDPSAGMECIRPVNISLLPSSVNLSGDSKSLYSAIWFRTVGSQGNPAKLERQTCVYSLDEEEVFRAEGSSITEGGWHQLSGRLFEPTLRPISPDVSLVEASVITLPARPPKRHTHGTLVAWLDSNLTSRPWAYKQALESMHQNLYVESLGGDLLKITDKGEAVLTFVRRAIPELLDLSFSSTVEQDLDEVESGAATFEYTIRKYWQWAITAANTASSKSLRPPFSSPTGKKLRIYLEKDSGKPYAISKGEDWWSYVSFDGNGKITLSASSV